MWRPCVQSPAGRQGDREGQLMVFLAERHILHPLNPLTKVPSHLQTCLIWQSLPLQSKNPTHTSPCTYLTINRPQLAKELTKTLCTWKKLICNTISQQCILTLRLVPTGPSLSHAMSSVMLGILRVLLRHNRNYKQLCWDKIRRQFIIKFSSN